MKPEPAANRPDAPDDLVKPPITILTLLDRHKVNDLTDPLGAQEARHKDTCPRKVHLFFYGTACWGDLKEPTFLAVQK